MKVNHVLETCLYANDLDAARAFYQEVLGLDLLTEEAGRHVFFRLDQGVLLIFNPEATREQGMLPPHGVTGAGHVAFRMDQENYEAWKAHLEMHDVAIELEHSWGDAGRSLYFRDPAGNSLELVNPGIWGLQEGH